MHRIIIPLAFIINISIIRRSKKSRGINSSALFVSIIQATLSDNIHVAVMVILNNYNDIYYGTPNLSWVSRSTLLYHGSQYVVLNRLFGKPIISEKLTGTPLTL